jgi:hypothetical protein
LSISRRDSDKINNGRNRDDLKTQFSWLPGGKPLLQQGSGRVENLSWCNRLWVLKKYVSRRLLGCEDAAAEFFFSQFG